MMTIRCGLRALVVSVVVVALYRELALAAAEAGLPPTMLVVAVAAGMATFGARLAQRWTSRQVGWWALFAGVFGVYALPVLLFQAARASGGPAQLRQSQ